MVDKQGATELDSPSGNSPAPEGKTEPKTTEQLLAEYKAENDRKATEISELRDKVGEVDTLREELEELRSKPNKTAADKREISSIDKQIEELESREDVRAWLEWTRRHTKKELAADRESIRDEILSELYEQQANQWLNDKADELKMDIKEFRKALLGFADGSIKMPTERVKAAYRDWQRVESIKKKEKEWLDKEKQITDAGDRAARESNRTEFDMEKQEDRIQAGKKLGL